MWAPSPVVRAEIRASARHLGIDVGRQSHRDLGGGERSQDVAPVAHGRHPVHARHLQGGRPGPGDEPIAGTGTDEPEPLDRRQGTVGELLRGGVERGAEVVGDARPPELGQEDLARGLVLNPGEHAPQDPERGRHHAAADATVHALGEDVHPDAGHQVAPQGRGQPQPVVAQASRVEADHE